MGVGTGSQNCAMLGVLFEWAEEWSSVGLRQGLHFFFKVGAITACLSTNGHDPAGKGSW